MPSISLNLAELCVYKILLIYTYNSNSDPTQTELDSCPWSTDPSHTMTLLNVFNMYNQQVTIRYYKNYQTSVAPHVVAPPLAAPSVFDP